MEIVELNFDDYSINTDRNKMDLIAIHDFLSKYSGWCNHIPLETVKNALDHSLNFGLFHQSAQIGFARIITDYSTIAYLGDVYILPDHQGKGLSKRLMSAIMTHPCLQGLRRWILLTSTADWLYEKYGFEKLPKPEIYMERHDPHVYARSS